MRGDQFYIKGKFVNARGCWQITKLYHPEITDAQADDLIFSTEWSLNVIKNKALCLHEFSTCRDFYSGKLAID